MRILILNPPYHSAIIREGRCQSPQNMRKTSIPQMTLAYLAGILEKDGHQLLVYDCIALCMSFENLFMEIEKFNPEIALINTTTPSIQEDLLFVKTLKNNFLNCFTILFGTHVTVLHEMLMESNKYIDCIIRNEPEWTALEICNSLQRGNIPSYGILGSTMRINGKIVVSNIRKFNPNLDSLGFPAWKYFDKSKYIHPVFNKPYVMVNTSRGCNHNCIFCVGHIFYGKSVRFRSVEKVLDEIEYVINEFQIHHIWMYADDFTHSPEYVKELCKGIINRKIKIIWWTNTRVDKLDEEMFSLMKAAGCFMLSIGGESGNAEILKNIKKGTKLDQINNTVKILRKVGINSLVYFLIGLPGENRETIKETFEFAKKVNPDYVEFYPATPYPGTEFFNTVNKDNLIIDSNWEKYLCGGNEFVIEIPGIKKNELDKIFKDAYLKFYFRPAYILTLLRRLSRPSDFFRLASFGIGYFRRFLTRIK